MRRFAPAFLGLTLLCVTAFACAGDEVRIRYLPGYPHPNRSSERIDVRIARVSPPTTTGDQGIDRFFAAVQATLSEFGIVRDWQMVIPDAPAIEITVELDGRRIRLASAHVPVERDGRSVVTERGIETLNQRSRDAVLSEQSESFRRHRMAFDRLLALTLQRAQARLGR